MAKKLQLVLLAATVALPGTAFQASSRPRHFVVSALKAEEQEWKGEVVNNEDGRIRGCTITPVSDTDFTIKIDGNEADLGNFGTAVYRKITSDAKRQVYQGFRPGTLPPHLLPTYKTFAMDEVAREAALEAMQQNDIRPFESGRQDILIEQVSIPPRPKKKKKKGRKKKKTADAGPQVVDDAPAPWETFDTIKEAIRAGWEPGQSFSFVAKNCKGQKLKPVEEKKPVI